MHRMKRRPSTGTIVALIALALAGGGTATARSIISSSDEDAEPLQSQTLLPE